MSNSEKLVGYDSFKSDESKTLGSEITIYKKTNHFTNEDLATMQQKMIPSELWKRAFDIYNADKNNSRLSMSCRPCFGKVMSYIMLQMNKQNIQTFDTQ